MPVTDRVKREWHKLQGVIIRVYPHSRMKPNEMGDGNDFTTDYFLYNDSGWGLIRESQQGSPLIERCFIKFVIVNFYSSDLYFQKKVASARR